MFRHRRIGMALFVVLAVVSGGCGDSEPEETAFYEAVVIDPERMRVEPEVAAPGETIEVYFPEGDNRGPGFVLERRDGEQWVWEWAVNTDSSDPKMISAETFRQGRYEWNSGPGFHDEGPHLIPIPEDSKTGEYRVCTAPDPPYCVPLQFSED